MRNCIDCQKEIKNKKAIRCPACYHFSRVGVKRPDYIGRKISLSKMGHIVTKESRIKMSLSKKGRHCNPSTEFKKGEKRLIGNQFAKGLTPWNKNKKTGLIPKTAFTRERVFGSNNVNWKGGTSTANDKARHNKEMVLWRKACLERDGFICQKTGQNGGDLVVHHINNFSDFPELRTSIENGITLSRQSHLGFHKKYGKKNNTKIQLQEFLSTNTSLSPYFQELLVNNKIK